MFDPDAKSSVFKRLFFLVRTGLHYHLSFKGKFERIDGMPSVWGIWNVVVYGKNITLGKNVVIVAADGYRTNLSTIRHSAGEGRITIGDNVLVMNGVRLSSASGITVGNDCMLANFCYLTDSDWHDIYDRTSTPGGTAPIVLEDGSWIGDSAIVCKGVRVGRNSIIGAGSVVTRDIPPNVIAAGNPARIVKKLDPEKIKTMKDLYERAGSGGRRKKG
ncbi:MAG: acyltransferase [Spirochaetes bacterium]|jgi:acetyltransferase-like isoleucine patch superfamily enzyme|nr:acyltransferase [Spirochaetota bacterium]